MIGEFQIPLKDKTARCLLCPKECILKEHQAGICLSRINKDGKIQALNYMETVTMALDPIEKKPLRKFHPGSKVLSIGPNGCNLRCPFCQNHSISQEKHGTMSIDIKVLLQMAKRYRAIGIAYTYAEPFIWFETLRDLMPAVHIEGLKNVVVTNGYINMGPLKRLLPSIDAMNIDIKTMDADRYRALGGDLDVVIRTCDICAKQTHVEISYIMTPGNENPEEIKDLARFCFTIGAPLHLLRYFPAHKMGGQPTTVEVMKEAETVAKKYLDDVFLENV